MKKINTLVERAWRMRTAIIVHSVAQMESVSPAVTAIRDRNSKTTTVTMSLNVLHDVAARMYAQVRTVVKLRAQQIPNAKQIVVHLVSVRYKKMFASWVRRTTLTTVMKTMSASLTYA